MDQRKLIKLGNSSFAIALPKGWVDKSGLNKGDNVFLEENSGGEIVLWSKIKKFAHEKEKEISMGEDISRVRKKIIAAYINGFTIIKLSPTKDKKKKKEIREFVNNLLSFEIIEDNDKRIVLKDFFNIEEAKIDNFIKRMDNNIGESFESFSSALISGTFKKSEFSEILKIDRDTTRFYLLISRLFHKGANNPAVLNALKKDSFSFFNDWWFAQNLEHIGDTIKETASTFFGSNISKENLSKLSKLFLNIYEFYKSTMEVVGSADRDAAILCAERGKEISKSCDGLARDKDSSVAKLAIKFKELEYSIYQNLKIVIYLREND